MEVSWGKKKTKLNFPLSYKPAIAPLGIYPREMKTYVDTKTCTGMFVAVLLVMAKNWNQIRCPSMGEQLKELDIPIPWNPAINRKEHSTDTSNNLYKSPENYAK